MAALLTNYNLKMLSDDIDRVLLRLSQCSEIEIRDVNRTSGIIQVATKNLENVADIPEIMGVDKDKKFYFKRMAII